MEHIAVITQFNQSAIKNKLTGLQMQLWYEIFAKVCEVKQDVYISTAELLNLLQVSRCQFQRARSGLIQAGLLAMRKESNQKVFYTVQLNGEMLAVINQTETAVQSTAQTTVQKETMTQQAMEQTMKQPTTGQKQTPALYPKAVDVLSNGSYHNEIVNFCDTLRLNSTKEAILELKTELMNWCMMRKENGWQLTKQGLEALLEKLKAISAESVTTMLEIVRTSIRRRWKGFYELRTESKPSGKKLLELERKEQKPGNNRYNWNYQSIYENKRNYKSSGRLPKYDTKKEDLDFLEW